ncbi:MAG: hypothetical protein V4568_11405 [Pseudomonadota bacterium]
MRILNSAHGNNRAHGVILQTNRVMLLLFAMMLCLNARADEFIVGVCTHFDNGINDAVKTVDLLQAVGVNSFRAEARWDRVETTKGVFKFPEQLAGVERAVDAARAKGIQPLIILDYGNKLYGGSNPVTDEARAGFARYSEFIVNHFKGKVRYYEVWNEWNSKGSPEDYARLLKQVYPAIKRADPSAIVLAGAVEGAGKYDYIQALMREDIVNYMDGFSIHPYVFWKGQKVGTPEYLMSWVQKLQQDILQKANGGKQVPIYITEIGWPVNKRGVGIENERVADYLARTLLMLRTLPYVRGVWWYEFRSDSFGMLASGNEQKPAYESMREVATLVSKAQFVERVVTAKDVWMLRFRNPDGSEVLASWRTTGEERWEVSFDHDSDSAAGATAPLARRVKGMAAVKEKGADVAPGKSAKSKLLTINESPLIVQDSKSMAVKGATKIQ